MRAFEIITEEFAIVDDDFHLLPLYWQIAEFSRVDAMHPRGYSAAIWTHGILAGGFYEYPNNGVVGFVA